MTGKNDEREESTQAEKPEPTEALEEDLSEAQEPTENSVPAADSAPGEDSAPNADSAPITDPERTDESGQAGKRVRGHSRHAQPQLTAGSIAVAVVMALAGLLFTVNARLAADPTSRQPRDLPGMIKGEEDRLSGRVEEVKGLEDEIARLTEKMGAEGQELPVTSTTIKMASGAIGVKGPGVKVQMWDASGNIPAQSSLHPDDLVVHQQDVQGVVDALWSGGAEAMTIQGQRVISTTAVRCVGNTLLLHGRTYSPPFVIESIGDSKKLRRAVTNSPAVKAYLDDVKRVGLGWAMDSEASISMPAYEGSWEMKYARVPNDDASESRGK